VPSPLPAYLFTKPLNWLDFDPTYPKSPKTFGEYIRKWRMDKGIFQVDLAKMLGVDEMTIVNWEKGRTRPDTRWIERVKGAIREISGFSYLPG